MALSAKKLRRPLLFAALCVVLGLLTSVGVAWRIAHTSTPTALQGSILTRLEAVAPIDDGTQRPGTTVWIRVSAQELPTVSLTTFASVVLEQASTVEPSTVLPTRGDYRTIMSASYLNAALERHTPLLRTEDAVYVRFNVAEAGWPWRCVAIEDACTALDARTAKGSWFLWNPVRSNYDKPATNPQVDPAFNLWPIYFHPVWPGLVANTTLFASGCAIVLGIAIVTGARLRRKLRQYIYARKGGCAQCGYSREGLKDGAACPECGRVPAAAANAATPASTIV